MELQLIQQKKKSLELKLQALISDFETETNTTVSNVQFSPTQITYFEISASNEPVQFSKEKPVVKLQISI